MHKPWYFYPSKLLAPAALALLLASWFPGHAQQVTTPAAARLYVQTHARALGLDQEQLSEAVVTNAYADAHKGISHIYLRQQIHGHEVLGSEMGVHIDRSGHLLKLNGAFVANAQARAASLPTPKLNAVTAKDVAARHLKLPTTLSTPAALLYMRRSDGTLCQVWQLAIRSAKGPDVWDVLIDATSGRVLKAKNRIVHEFGSILVAPSAS